MKTNDIATFAATPHAAGESPVVTAATEGRSRPAAPPRNDALPPGLAARGGDSFAGEGASSSRNVADVARLRGLGEAGASSSATAAGSGHAAYQHASATDLAEIGRLADRLGELEARLQSSVSPVAASRDDLERQVRRLQAERDRASEGIDEMAQQVARARVVVETRERGLSRKFGQLEQLQQQLEALTTSSSAAGPSLSAPAGEDPAVVARRDRLDALKSQQSNLKQSRASVSRHAGEVAERDERRRLIDSTRGLEDVQMQSAVADWFRASRTPGTGRSRGGAQADRPFAEALDAAFRRIADCGKDGGPTPREAVGALMDALERCVVKVVKPTCEKCLTMVVADHAVISEGANAGLWARTLRRAMNRTGIGMANVAAQSLEIAIRTFVANLGKARAANVATQLTDGQVLRGRSLERAITQCTQLLDGVIEHRDALVGALTEIERAFAQPIDNGPEEALGRQAAPQLGTYYSRELKRVSSEISAMSCSPSRATDVQPIISSSTAQSINDLEVRILRLQGEIEQQVERHRADFERFEAVSARHSEAGDEVAAIERELARDRIALDDLRAERRERLQAERARQAEVGDIARELDTAWTEALASPAVHQIISPEALLRVNRVHLNQSPEQMVARLATLPRTGTFMSRASLLRALTDIARQEQSKPPGESALLTTSEQALARLPGARDDGRIDALCSHGRTIGSGVRRSAAVPKPSRTGTSQYTVGWIAGQGPRITHLHPWISPY